MFSSSKGQGTTDAWAPPSTSSAHFHPASLSLPMPWHDQLVDSSSSSSSYMVHSPYSYNGSFSMTTQSCTPENASFCSRHSYLGNYTDLSRLHRDNSAIIQIACDGHSFQADRTPMPIAPGALPAKTCSCYRCNDGALTYIDEGLQHDSLQHQHNAAVLQLLNNQTTSSESHLDSSALLGTEAIPAPMAPNKPSRQTLKKKKGKKKVPLAMEALWKLKVHNHQTHFPHDDQPFK